MLKDAYLHLGAVPGDHSKPGFDSSAETVRSLVDDLVDVGGLGVLVEQPVRLRPE